VKKIALLLPLALVAAISFSPSARAAAEATPTESGPGSIAIAGLVGDGIGFKNADDGPYKLGIGVRGGITLPSNLYLGGAFVYHAGTSRNGATGNTYYLGGEGGFDLHGGPLVLRPYVGLGILTARASIDGFGSDTKSYLYVAPGFAALVPLGDRWFVGGDARVLTLPSERSEAWNLTLMATFGARL